MPLVLSNRVQETATANTTVSFTLTGAVSGFQTFGAIGDTNTTYYSATDGNGNWEVGLGTYSTTGPTLTRTTVYESSNAGSAVTFSGSVNVFVTYPSGKSVNLDASGNVSALGTVASGAWQGSTVGVAYGGTGVTASSGANSVVLRDANQNITVNRLNQGLQTTTAAGGTTVLTAASQFNQLLTGTGNQTFTLPDATTLSDTTAFQFNNNATGTLTIQDNASATIGTVAPGGAAGIALLSNATVGGTWDVHAYIPENVTWGTNALALGSTVISGGTWQGGTIASGYGGTGLTTFTGANNALYSTSSSALTAGTLPLAAGGTGQTTAQTAMNAFAGAVTSGSYLRGNGTNVTMSTIQAGDVPTLNQNTTGTAAGLSSTLAVASGGTGQTTYTNGQLLIGNTTGNTLAKATLTAGSGITITNGSGAITIAASGGSVSCATPSVAGKVYGRSTFACARTGLGGGAGCISQGNNSVAIGYQAAYRNQGTLSVAIGKCAGKGYQGVNSVTIGALSNLCCQACTSVTVGYSANSRGGSNCSVVIGPSAYADYSVQKAIVIGVNSYAAQSPNSRRAVVIGSCSIATGFNYCVETKPVVVGSNSSAYSFGVVVGANSNTNDCYGVSVGVSIVNNQKCSVAIGRSVQLLDCGGPQINSVAIGKSAYSAKSYGIAIGSTARSFVCNGIALGKCVSNNIPNSTVIATLRNVSTCYFVRYNPTTKELSYA
jgi:hypothetical protein